MESCSEGPRLQPFRFSTDMLAPGERLARWREEWGRTLMRLDFEPLGAEVRASFEHHACGVVNLYFAETNPVSISRTRELLSDGNGDYTLMLHGGGARYTYLSGDIDEDMESHDAALVFNGSAGTLRRLGACRPAILRIARKALVAVVPDLDERPIRRVPPASRPLLRLLTGYTETVRQTGSLSHPSAAHRIAHHLIDLVALALVPTEAMKERTGPASLRQVRLASIRADVLANLSELQLSATSIARKHGLTPRYIHRLFEETGETFGRFVERERMKRAFALLTDPYRPAARIGDIALLVGFVEHSSFNRAFRRCFGSSPRDVRRSHERGERLGDAR